MARFVNGEGPRQSGVLCGPHEVPAENEERVMSKKERKLKIEYLAFNGRTNKYENEARQRWQHHCKLGVLHT